MIVLGLMSGTSADGIDAAVVQIDESGDEIALRVLGYHEEAYEPGLRERILALMHPERGRVEEVCEVNAAIGEAFAAVGGRAVEEAGAVPDLVASHGQTIWHAVAYDGSVRGTLQIGEPSVIAERLGATVVADFRPRDVAAGGQGAPLASYPDALLFADATKARAIQNLGGIGNVTWLPPGGGPADALAFDTGPANALIDVAVARLTEGARSFDRDGALAAAGRVDDAVLAELLGHAYYAQRPPKSTGRELFSAPYADAAIDRLRERGATVEDVIATLTMLTVRSVADAYHRFLPRLPDEVVLGGGGARNPTLRRWLTESLPGVTLRDHDEFRLPSTGREAIYFAVLGYQAIHGRTNTLPGCTGARRAVVMGKIVPGANYVALAQAARPDVAIRRMRVREIEASRL